MPLLSKPTNIFANAERVYSHRSKNWRQNHTAKDFVSNVETQAENLLMRCWEKAFSPDERELLQSRRKDQDYLDIVW